MHFMPDTEDADSAAEEFWPEGYKQVIREDFRQLIGAELDDGKRLRHIYQQQYSERYSDLNQFVSKIADMIAIGAEKEADEVFEDIITAFLTEGALPEGREYACYFWPQAFSQGAKDKLVQVIVDEYSQDNVYIHAYKVGYQRSFRNFDEYINQIAKAVVIGAMNGADDMLEAIYGSFMNHGALPPARRNPRRLKVWVLPS